MKSLAKGIARNPITITGLGGPDLPVRWLTMSLSTMRERRASPANEMNDTHETGRSLTSGGLPLTWQTLRRSTGRMSSRICVIADFTFKFKELYDQYDILFLLPSFETYGGVIVVADIVNELILNGIKANVVCFRETAQRLEIDKYFEPLWIPADELHAGVALLPKFSLRPIIMTAFHAIELARRDKAKCLYFIQDDERRFEEADHEIAKLSYEAIPNHIYVSGWLEETFSQRAHFHRVIQNGIYRDIFYPGPKAGLDGSTAQPNHDDTPR